MYPIGKDRQKDRRLTITLEKKAQGNREIRGGRLKIVAGYVFRRFS